MEHFDDRLTVLIVDEDLRFAFWLGRLLDGAGYCAWPARNGADAAELLKEIGGRLNLLVIDPDSQGAAALVDDLRREKQVKAIAAPQLEDRLSVLDGMSAAFLKPRTIDELSGLEWIHAIEQVLAG